MMRNSMGLLNTDWIIYYYIIIWASLVAQLVKKLPAMQETPVQFLGWKDSPGEGVGYPLQYSLASLVAQTVKNLPAKWETWVWSLGWEDPLEKGKATHSNILAWRIPWTQSMGSQRVRHDWVTFTFSGHLGCVSWPCRRGQWRRRPMETGSTLHTLCCVGASAVTGPLPWEDWKAPLPTPWLAARCCFIQGPLAQWCTGPGLLTAGVWPGGPRTGADVR